MYDEIVLFCCVSGFGSVSEWVLDDFGYFPSTAGVLNGELIPAIEINLRANVENKINRESEIITNQANSGVNNRQKP